LQGLALLRKAHKNILRKVDKNILRKVDKNILRKKDKLLTPLFLKVAAQKSGKKKR
jgi:hypothetical protein